MLKHLQSFLRNSQRLLPQDFLLLYQFCLVFIIAFSQHDKSADIFYFVANT